MKYPGEISAWQSWKEALHFGLLVNLTHTANPNGTSCHVEISGLPTARFLGPPQAYFLSLLHVSKLRLQSRIQFCDIYALRMMVNNFCSLKNV